jgi:hypothetical protein
MTRTFVPMLVLATLAAALVAPTAAAIFPFGATIPIPDASASEGTPPVSASVCGVVTGIDNRVSCVTGTTIPGITTPGRSGFCVTPAHPIVCFPPVDPIPLTPSITLPAVCTNLGALLCQTFTVEATADAQQSGGSVTVAGVGSTQTIQPIVVTVGGLPSIVVCPDTCTLLAPPSVATTGSLDVVVTVVGVATIHVPVPV